MKLDAEWYYYHKNFLTSGYEKLKDSLALEGYDEMIRLEDDFIRSLDSCYVSKDQAIKHTAEWEDNYSDLNRIYREQYFYITNSKNINRLNRYQQALAKKMVADINIDFEKITKIPLPAE